MARGHLRADKVAKFQIQMRLSRSVSRVCPSKAIPSLSLFFNSSAILLFGIMLTYSVNTIDGLPVEGGDELVDRWRRPKSPARRDASLAELDRLEEAVVALNRAQKFWPAFADVDDIAFCRLALHVQRGSAQDARDALRSVETQEKILWAKARVEARFGEVEVISSLLAEASFKSPGVMILLLNKFPPDRRLR